MQAIQHSNVSLEIDHLMSTTIPATFGLLAVDCCALIKVHVTTKAAMPFIKRPVLVASRFSDSQ